MNNYKTCSLDTHLEKGSLNNITLKYDENNVRIKTKQRRGEETMSKSTIVKEQIMEILSDKQEHNASDIKAAIRKKYADMDITEGVFSNSFRTLTLAKKCINKERGIYILNTDKNNNVIDEKKNNELDKINKCCDENNSNELKDSGDYIKLQSCVSEMLVKWREEFRNLVKDINILDADDKVVSYVLEVRHALENLEKGIRR